MSAQMFDKTLGILVELSWEFHFLIEGHLKDLVRIISHEWRSSVKTLVNENSKGVPIYRRMVSLVLYDFWGNILRSAAESVSPVSRHESLDKAKISKLDVPV